MTARALRLALSLLCGASFLIFGSLALARIRYPLELDCIEGVMMDHVARLAEGRSIYVAPSLQFIPLAYMPLLAFLASLLARVFGPAFWEPRLVSILAVAALTLILSRAVWLDTRERLLAFASPAIYLFSMGITGNCHDVGRPDSLMLALAFGGLLTLRETRGRGGAAAAALLLAAAFFAKQHAVWFGLAGAAHLVVNDRRRLAPYLITLAVAAGGAWLALSLWLGPWFAFFTWEVPHDWSQLSTARVLHYIGDGVLGALAIMTVPALLALGLPQKIARGPGGIWVFAAVAGIGSGLMSTLDPSAYLHVLTPTVVALAILGPICIHALSRRLAELGSERAAIALPAVLLLLNFVPLAYPIRTQRPRPGAHEARRELVARLQALPGGVMMPYHGFYAAQAGKGTWMHIIALDDIARARGNPLLAKDPDYLGKLMAPLRAGAGRPAILTDMPLERSGPLWAAIAPGYRLADSLGALTAALVPLTGNKYSPALIYLPVEPPAAVASASPAVTGAPVGRDTERP